MAASCIFSLFVFNTVRRCGAGGCFSCLVSLCLQFARCQSDLAQWYVTRRSAGKRKGPGSTLRFAHLFFSKSMVYGHCLETLPCAINETFTWLTHRCLYNISMRKSVLRWQCSVGYIQFPLTLLPPGISSRSDPVYIPGR